MLNNNNSYAKCEKLKIALIPIDNRPICYDLVKDILSINKNIELFMPEIKDLGGLTTNAEINNLFSFLENLNSIDYLILSLDTLAYGGLVSSRRSGDDFEEIKERILKFKEIAQKKCGKILAFSSIMRISNNNINEEEKFYWQNWGKKIFDWSFNFHKSLSSFNDFYPDFPENEIKKLQIPAEILKDYIKTRKRNLEINKLYLDLAKEGFFDALIFSKDDCAEFGLNILEADILKDLIDKNNIKNTFIKTGADEIPLSLISRALTDYQKSKNQKITIKPIFLEENPPQLSTERNPSETLSENPIDKISKYEDISIKNCVLSQISLAGLELSRKNPDLVFVINNFEKEQGDFVLGKVINSIHEKSKEKLGEILSKSNANLQVLSDKILIADVNNANGADCDLIEFLFENLSQKSSKNFINDNFYGFCAYNTSANTIGCAILIGLVKIIAKCENSYDDCAFRKIMFIRFLDDWAYQSISRKFVRENGGDDFKKTLDEKTRELNKNAQKISGFLDFYPEKITYSLPWERSFEIRIKID